jgi:large subunit ribosomal protein L7Ae
MVLPAIAQFNLDKNTASQLFMLLDKYRPETKQEKKARLATVAQAAVGGSARAFIHVDDYERDFFVAVSMNVFAVTFRLRSGRLMH